MEASTANLPLTWTKTSPSPYERSIDAVERFYLFIATAGQGRQDNSHWRAAMGLKIETKRERFVEQVKQAWRALRYDPPGLSAFIESDRWVYHVADQEELSSWLEETFHVHDDHRSA